jgi:hypothetical protein
VNTWRAARRHCRPDCFGYHATWPLVRAAGIKASPSWHRDFYRSELSAAGLATGTNRVRILIAGTADHTLTRVLAELIDPHRLDLTVIDRCPTPLKSTGRLALDLGVPALRLETASIPEFPTVIPAVDVAVTDGLLSLLPDETRRRATLAWLAASLKPSGTLLYTTRLTADAEPLDFDRLGRAIQTAAALTWPRREPRRRSLALTTWRRPARAAPYTDAGQLHDEISREFGHVQIHADPEPPTPALRHTRRTRGAPNFIVRAAATNPRPVS